MKKTEHYQLNLWDGDDFILREDFNADNEKLETALTALNEKATPSEAAANALGLADGDASARGALEFLSRFNLHWWRRRQAGETAWSYLCSHSRDAYPDTGDDGGGAEYEYLGVPYENFTAPLRLASGSYEGTGLTNTDTVIRLPFAAKAVYVTAAANGTHSGLFVAGGTSAITGWATSSGTAAASYALEGSTLTIGAQNVAARALNQENETYLWYALG